MPLATPLPASIKAVLIMQGQDVVRAVGNFDEPDTAVLKAGESFSSIAEDMGKHHFCWIVDNSGNVHSGMGDDAESAYADAYYVMTGKLPGEE